MSDTVSVPVYVMPRAYVGHRVYERAELPPNPSRRSDAMTKYLVMKREARVRDWNRYHPRVGVVIVP